MYPHGVIHGYELDPAVISVGREYFGLSKVEKQYPDRLFIYISNAINASVKDGYAGLIVDLFSKGCLIPELQDPQIWEKLKVKLKKGGKIIVNVGGSCVEPEDIRRDGKVIMEETLMAMNKVFEGEVYVLNLGNRKQEDSSVAIAGGLPDLEKWRMSLPKPLRFYVDMWNNNALNASVKDGYIVDLFSKGYLIPELQDPQIWVKLKKGGKIMVNVGGSCVEPEDIRRDGKVIMKETLMAMNKVLPGEVYVLNLENRRQEDSTVAGGLPDLEKWRMSLPKPLRFYVDMWNKYGG
ncbi:hypothetical protein RND71_010291 [Anisodus tanguticus]|uniref:Uncharacterized protein n=1 Tax=Anisodus tanguticus TaxID=243964 RepID=A0AAE1SJI9_9SOLA|nr:hypothetical protein RND71_010291 [Anisodus tanguticus]